MTNDKRKMNNGKSGVGAATLLLRRFENTDAAAL
jgi:hypothetical protein